MDASSTAIGQFLRSRGNRGGHLRSVRRRSMLRTALGAVLVLTCLQAASFAGDKKPGFDPDKLSSLLGAKPLKPGPGADDLQKKLVERYNSGVRIYELQLDAYKKKRATAQQVIQAARLVLDAELALKSKRDERVAVREKMVAVAEMNESVVEELVAVGQANAADRETTRYERITAEVELLKEKKGP